MITLSVNNITKSYGIETIINDISFAINEGEKIGLVGSNGAGKTTLFRIITGRLEKDSGQIFFGKDITIGYLEQNVKTESENSLLDEALLCFEDVIKLERELRELEHRISESAHDKNLDSLMNEYSRKTEQFTNMNGYSYNSEARGILKGLGFSESDFEKPVNLLSGGEQTRLMLSKLLLKKPDVLLLDEPTNHLDTMAVEWLETYLKQYRGNVVVISHDRYFLDKIVDRIFEIHNRTLTQYGGNYTDYLEKRETVQQLMEKEYKENQEEIKRQKDIIAQLKAFGREKQVKRARSREKLLDKMDTVDKPDFAKKKASITFSPSVTSGYEVMKVESLSKAFGERVLFSDLDIQIFRNEKVALLGPNGVGKTTLFNILLGKDTAYQGQVTYGTNVHPVYFDQTRQDLNQENSIIDEVWNEYPSLTETRVRSMLAAFLFTGDDVYKRISSLSGGEQSRISLLKLMLSNANFLFLDEPTNHLDIESKEVLENALNVYEGTVFFISHDRYFINKLADKVLVLTEDGIREFLGNYDYYQEKLQHEKEDRERNQSEASQSNVTRTQIKAQQKKDKEKEKEYRKLKKSVTDTEQRISEIESEIENCHQQLCLEEIYSNPEMTKKVTEEKNRLETELAEAFEKWEELHLMLEDQQDQ